MGLLDFFRSKSEEEILLEKLTAELEKVDSNNWEVDLRVDGLSSRRTYSTKLDLYKVYLGHLADFEGSDGRCRDVYDLSVFGGDRCIMHFSSKLPFGKKVEVLFERIAKKVKKLSPQEEIARARRYEQEQENKQKELEFKKFKEFLEE